MFNSYIEAASLSISGEVNEIVKIPSKQQMFTHLTTFKCMESASLRQETF